MDFNKVYEYTQDLNILYVEDDIRLQEETSDIFESFFLNTELSINGEEALDKYKSYFKVHQKYYDIVITDLNMPKMDGETLIEKIYEINSEQTIIVISAYNESSRLVNLIQKGISNFILKPTEPDQLMNSLYSTCKTVSNKNFREKYYKKIEDISMDQSIEIKQQKEELQYTQELSIETIAEMVEHYDDETGTHVKRIENYTKVLIEKVSKIMPVEDKEFIPFASVLHDIGKLMVPKDILTKPAKLTPLEMDVMKGHAKLGGLVLENANNKFKKKFNKDSYLKTASDIAMYHHEKYNGLGYPSGLKAQEIPLCARVVAIVDVYDALRSKRVYKDGFTHAISLDIIKSESGKSFDPQLVDLFLESNEEFDEIFNTL